MSQGLLQGNMKCIRIWECLRTITLTLRSLYLCKKNKFLLHVLVWPIFRTKHNFTSRQIPGLRQQIFRFSLQDSVFSPSWNVKRRRDVNASSQGNGKTKLVDVKLFWILFLQAEAENTTLSFFSQILNWTFVKKIAFIKNTWVIFHLVLIRIHKPSCLSNLCSWVLWSWLSCGHIVISNQWGKQFCCLISTNWSDLFFRNVTINIEKQEKHSTGQALCLEISTPDFFLATTFSLWPPYRFKSPVWKRPFTRLITAQRFLWLTLLLLKPAVDGPSIETYILHAVCRVSAISSPNVFFFFFFSKMWEGNKIRLAKQKINQDRRRVNLLQDFHPSFVVSCWLWVCDSAGWIM